MPPEILEDGNLYRIPFAAESSDIPEISESRLDEIARRMKEDENLRLQLLGYATGETESASAARRLSLFRALSVRTYLVKHGIRSTRVDVRALGAKESDGMPDRVDIVFKK